MTARSSPKPRRRAGVASAVVYGMLGVAVLILLWELYRAFGPPQGLVVGAVEGQTGSGIRLLPRADERTMPHVWDMIGRAIQPVTRAPGALPLGAVVLIAALNSLLLSTLGLALGFVVGMLLALVMLRIRLAEWAVLPFVILSQTVPLIALAPLIRNWGSRLEFGSFSWESWMSVVVIASYLAFFPIAIGALRGLKSPDTIHEELFQTYAVGWWATLVRLRLPASVPFLLPALRLGAAGAVVGTVVAEISVGYNDGIGRLILETSAAASTDPARPWSPVFGAILLGLLAAGLIALISLALTRFRRTESLADA
ncbi:ABC transporter permease [Microbacterium sp. NPDC056044]|uniref:ABC transporter permease n=1 Tax=Microbacterium sp. NPDC056044 TaxID=3345690 RepID=UPI0035D8EDBD